MPETTERKGLSGAEVAITGKLASMSREEAQRRIVDAGGSYVAALGPNTTWLVVGQGGPPLGEDGRLTNTLREARDRIAAGDAVRILSETELLLELGLDDRRVDLERLFTTAQLSRILGVPAAQVRAWVRHDLIRPVKVVRRLAFFDFPQVATAKALCQLSQTGVTPQRLRKSLEELGAWLPEAERSLAQLETLEQGGPVLVRTPEGRLAETSGQLRLEFQPEHDDELIPAPPPATRAVTAPSISADAWFDRGLCAEEEERLDEAEHAYREALLSAGPRADISFNLGNLLYALGRKAEAAERLRVALEIEPEFVEAWNNLGNALSDLGRRDDAVTAYRRALAIEPAYADAHYNLAETLAAAGDLDGAAEHWRAYLDRDPRSAWADEVRKRLAAVARGLG